MCKFYVLSGRVVEVQRFINVPRSTWKEYPARERRELWIATPTGHEVKLVVHSRQMPARYGHQVDALLLDGQVVGLHNLTTGGQVNYLRAEPPLLLRRLDVAGIALVLMAGLVSFLAGAVTVPIVAALLAMGVPPPVLVLRLVRSINVRSKVSSALDRLACRQPQRPASRPLLRRVK